MALKQTYTTESEIPTELKAHYVLKDTGSYELQIDGITSVSGILAKNNELITKQKTDKAEIDRQTQETARLNGEIGRLSGDLSKAQSGTVPTGYVAVSKKDNDLILKLKEQNLKPEDVLTTLTEAETLRGENSEFKLNQSIADFAKAENIQNVEALVRLVKQDGLTPQVKEIDEKGVKTKRGVLIKKVDDKDVEHSYSDYKNANWGAFATALDAQVVVKPGTVNDPSPQGGPNSFFDRLKTSLTEERKANVVPVADIDARFGRPAQAA